MSEQPAKTRRIKRGWMNLKVEKIFEETHDTKTFYLVDAEEGGRPFDFIAGQYLTFRFDSVSEKPIVRSYTMSGSPCQTEYVIFTVKRIPNGLISNWLCDTVRVGDTMRARGPIGKFCYDPTHDADHLFMVAGGSGVTPFISIIRESMHSLNQPGFPKSLNLLVAYRSREDLICWREIEEARAITGVNIAVTLTREDARNEGFWLGRPDEKMLERFIDSRYQNATFMTCGPQALMDLCIFHTKKREVDDDHIKTESFES